MNDKEKQIEEMAKVIFEYVDSKDRKNVYIVHSGIAEDMKTYSHNYGVAEALYNAGYRKIDKDSVILSREECQEILYVKPRTSYLVLDDEIKEISKEFGVEL